MAAVRLSRNYLPAMLAAGWGRILFSASTTGGFRSGEMVHYGTTKTALLGLARGLAETVSGSGVTVNCFLPGPMRERTDEVIEWEKELFTESVLSTSLLERFITPEELANFVVFLASDQASAITGSALRVDGGIVRSLV